MNYKKLKKQRLACPDIPTDNEGNLLMPENERRVSGTKRCAESLTGVFYKKNHGGDPALEHKLGSYKQYSFGDIIPPEQQTDKRLATTDLAVEENSEDKESKNS